jgi:hypothetical protein
VMTKLAAIDVLGGITMLAASIVARASESA